MKVHHLFFAAGCVALAYCGFTLVEAGIYQSSVPVAMPVLPPADLQRDAIPARAPEGTPVSRLEIPRLGLSVLVGEGTSFRTLRLGAGHIRGTAAPDEQGNVGIAAHRDTFFRKLNGVHLGDTITLTTPTSSWRYAVEWTRIVSPNDTKVLRQSPEPVLTLVTCYPFYFIGKAPKRFIIRAKRLPA
jgi:sortase A